jgi:hypothetical protein
VRNAGIEVHRVAGVEQLFFTMDLDSERALQDVCCPCTRLSFADSCATSRAWPKPALQTRQPLPFCQRRATATLDSPVAANFTLELGTSGRRFVQEIRIVLA